MKLPEPKHTWDVMVVATLGSAADLAVALCGHLEVRGLRVKLKKLPPGTRALPLPREVVAEAAKTRCCVVLAVNADIAGATSESPTFMYAILAAPRYPSQVAKYAEPGAAPKAGEFEMGMIQGDMLTLVEQIAGRLPPVSR